MDQRIVLGYKKGVAQDPQYLKTAVLKNPHVREICDFFSVS